MLAFAPHLRSFSTKMDHPDARVCTIGPTI
jgi:hypothetical protein